MEISYGTKVIFYPETRELFCPRTKKSLGKAVGSFNLVDCYSRGSFILGVLTDSNPSRVKIPFRLVDGKFTFGQGYGVTFLDNITLTENGTYY